MFDHPKDSPVAKPTLTELIDQFCFGSIDEVGLEQLQQLLRDSRAHRDQFRQEMQLHAALHEVADSLAGDLLSDTDRLDLQSPPGQVATDSQLLANAALSRSDRPLPDGRRHFSFWASLSVWPSLGEGVQHAVFGSPVERSQAAKLSNNRLNRNFFSRLGGAFLGLIVGIISTTAIWAATASARTRVLNIFHDSFESGLSPIANGSPMEPDAWGGDHAEIVEALPSLQPANGKRMLRFLRADYVGKEHPTGYICDVYRVIDLRGHTFELSHGDTLAAVKAAFGSVPFDETQRFYSKLSMCALAKLPADEEAWRVLIWHLGTLTEGSLASANRRQELSSDITWQQLSLEMRLPSEARYLLIGLHVADYHAARKHGSSPPAVEFEGQFADDVRVTLRRASDRD